MVNPTRNFTAMACALALTALAPGCAVVPKARLDEATKVTQALRAENSQLRDQTLTLRGENDDLAERALGDARKIAALERGNERLQASVQGYIDEREDLVDQFQKFRRLAQAATGSDLSAGLSGKLRTFASAHPGTTFDEAAGTVSVSANALFVPGNDRLRPTAARWLDDLAALLAAPEVKSLPVVVSARASDPAVHLASTAVSASCPADLAVARASRVRDALAERAGQDRSRIGVAAPGPAGKATAGSAGIEIAFGPAAR